jgi:hypothetical protein
MRALIARPDVREKLRAHLEGDGNPFKNPSVSSRGTATNREHGFPTLNGGNGTGLTKAQHLLSQKLNWPTEVVVVTDALARESGSPWSYKVDIANPETLIAIEVDGETHRTLKVRERDCRKTAFLERTGWMVYRFTNRQVIEHLDDVVASITSRQR